MDISPHRYAYTVYGEGDDVVLAFHGLYQDSSSFQALYQGLSGLKIISIDLPYHGNTDYRGKVVAIEDMMQLVAYYQQQYSFKKCHLLGFSIGGRVAMEVFLRIPESILSLTLMASDGLKMDAFYRFAIYNFFGKKIFNAVMSRPKFLLSFVQIAKGLKLLPAKTLHFVKENVQDPDIIRTVKVVWPGMKRFKIDRDKTVDTINQFHLPMLIIMGRKDQIIPKENATPWIAKIPTAVYHEIESGHLFTNDYAIKQLIPLVQRFYSNVKNNRQSI